MILAKIQDVFIDLYLRTKSPFDPSPFGAETLPYWLRRKQIFSKFASGIQTDAEGLYSATPEKIAQKIAGQMSAASVVDACCGIGSLSIAFAKAGKKVYAVDNNPKRLGMARHNAEVYGAADKIEFICQDIFNVIGNASAEAIFLDPPWGGANYLEKKDFGLKDYRIDLERLLPLAFKNYRQVMLLAPRQFDFEGLKKFGVPFTVEPNYLRSKLYSQTIIFKC